MKPYETSRKFSQMNMFLPPSSAVYGANEAGHPVFRYYLRRPIRGNVPDGKRRAVMFCMLNPSTASETENDPTVRRCIGFANDWGFDDLIVTNLYALRSPDPNDLRTYAGDPVGPENDDWILQGAAEAEQIICAWGGSGPADGRSAHVRSLLLQHEQNAVMRANESARVFGLKFNKNGEPAHPLYLPKNSLRQPLLNRTDGYSIETR